MLKFVSMLSSIEIESKLRDIKPMLAEKYHVSKIGYFGSYATGKQDENSDLDLLVEFSEPVGWSFFSLEIFLEQFLGIDVDLTTGDAIKEQIKASVFKQVKYI